MGRSMTARVLVQRRTLRLFCNFKFGRNKQLEKVKNTNEDLDHDYHQLSRTLDTCPTHDIKRWVVRKEINIHIY